MARASYQKHTPNLSLKTNNKPSEPAKRVSIYTKRNPLEPVYSDKLSQSFCKLVASKLNQHDYSPSEMLKALNQGKQIQAMWRGQPCVIRVTPCS